MKLTPKSPPQLVVMEMEIVSTELYPIHHLIIACHAELLFVGFLSVASAPQWVMVPVPVAL